MAPLHWEERFDNIWSNSIFDETLEEKYYELYDVHFFSFRTSVIDEVVNFPYYSSFLSDKKSLSIFPSTDIFSDLSFYEVPEPLPTVTISGITFYAHEVTFQLLNLLSSHSDISLHF